MLTVEPGIYFIPALIDQWQTEKKHAAFIRYDKVEKFRAFGGIRIEDDILVTAKGGACWARPFPRRRRKSRPQCAAPSPESLGPSAEFFLSRRQSLTFRPRSDTINFNVNYIMRDP